MFQPAEMREVNLLVAEQDIDEVTRAIARMGVLQLLDVSDLGQELPVERVDRRELIGAYSELDRRVQLLIDAMAPGGAPDSAGIAPSSQQSADEIDSRIREAEAEVHSVTDSVAQIDEQLVHLDPLAEQLELMAPVDISVQDLQALDYLHMAVGLIPSANLDRLHTSLFHVPYVILPFRRRDEHVGIFAFTAKTDAEILERALKSAYFQPFEIPQEFSGTPDEVAAQIRARIDGLSSDRQELIQHLDALWDKWREELLALHKRLEVLRTLARATENFARTDHVYLISGWVPKRTASQLLSELQKIGNGRVVAEVNAPEEVLTADRAVPSALQNPRLLRPFELVTTTFGEPSYKEIDPTPLVALTFFLMFGWMFGDLGHGFLVALTGLIVVSGRFRALRGSERLGAVLVACGLSSMLFGVLYGSVFGVETLIPALWLRPLRSILNLLIASIAFGVIAINIGFIFNLINAWRRRDWYAGLFSGNGVAGFLLYWALVGSVLAFALHVRLRLGLVLIFIAVPALLLLLGEPLANLIGGVRPVLSTGVFGYLVQAAFEVFEALVAYLSNTLSYVRLGAFAVAHIGLTLIVFIIGDLFSGIIVLRWLIIIVGTIGIVAFEGLIVGIQTLRLEYYEFFTRFFGGAGKTFQPLHVPEA